MVLCGSEALEAGVATNGPFRASSVYRYSHLYLLEISITPSLQEHVFSWKVIKGWVKISLVLILALKLNPGKQIVSFFPEKILNPIYLRFLFKLKIL